MKNRGMGSVFQPTYTERDTDGKKITKVCTTWQIKYYVNGKPIKESAHSTNRAVAVKLLKQRIGQVQAGKPVGSQVENTTLFEILEMVTNDYAVNHRKSTPSFAVKRLLDFFNPDTKTREINSAVLDRYIKQRQSDGYKNATINQDLSMLGRAFNLAADAGRVAMVPRVKRLKVSNARKGFFEVQEHRAVLAHLPYYLKPLAEVAYLTGWRKSELLKLHWRQVDFEKGWLRLETGETKNDEGRPVSLTPELRAVLEAQRQRVREIEKATNQIIPWVFVHFDMTHGKAAEGSKIRSYHTAWNNACKNAGVPGRLMHDYRRTQVRNLERAGVPRSTAMKMTGHKTEAVYRRYAIVDEGMLREGAEKLSAFYSRRSE